MTAAVLAVCAALLPGVAAAQEVTSSDQDEVMIWTAVVSVLALLACAVGYAYRRMRGMDHPTPDELQMMEDHGPSGHGEHHGETGHGAHAAH
ncbi:MAG: hypothetical protein ACRDJE_20945 [Dehalococcoidia bacterium]